MYFWMNGAMHEPHYSHSRIILSKMMAFITILDDFIDTYSTTEESMQLAKAIFRSDHLSPMHIQTFVLDFLSIFLMLIL
ncbi:hypothetical protein PR202_ga30616 [Eleusine coracana subsp. coracana]|uniref:Terpene synthase metal-binding domain-containing protein n=1 Tax=Eleusine coracana subsp. coracana TaxID=191504 RepID=A0AAV5DPH9_ELECO|nr:hypothetical protein PR202_ga30616 [Eleusine coracana subsp. coracana]